MLCYLIQFRKKNNTLCRLNKKTCCSILFYFSCCDSFYMFYSSKNRGFVVFAILFGILNICSTRKNVAVNCLIIFRKKQIRINIESVSFHFHESSNNMKTKVLMRFGFIFQIDISHANGK